MMSIIIIISFFSPPIHFIKRAVHFLPPPTPSHPFILLSSPPSLPLASSAVWSMGLRHVAKLVEPSRPPPSPSPPPPSRHPPPPVQLCPSPQVAARSDVRHERRRVRSLLHRRPRQTATSVGRGGLRVGCVHASLEKNDNRATCRKPIGRSFFFSQNVFLCQ